MEHNEEIINENIINNQKPIKLEKLKDIILKGEKCVVKILMEDENNNKIGSGTGFFCKLPIRNNYLNVLLTNNHVINEKFLDTKKELKIEYLKHNKIINLNKNRFKFTNSDNDFTIIEILDEDLINDFFEVEEYINENDCLNKEISIIQYPKGDDISLANGIIQAFDNKFIKHSASTEQGSSGSPIIFFNNIKVIGIHKGFNKKENINLGIFINKIIQRINFIKCVYDIKESDVGKEIQIINNKNKKGEKKNNEIENLEIYLNGIKKDFTLKYQFHVKGKESLILIFRENMTNMSYMFYKCSSLTSLNLSNFNTNNVTNTDHMVYECSSLTSLNLSNFNTNNVNNMSYMFFNCSSLNSLNLSILILIMLLI